MDARERLGLWSLRVGWLVLAIVATVPASEALDHRSTSVVTVSAVLAYGSWFAALVAMLVPRTSSLTVVRTIVPASLPAAVMASSLGDASAAVDAATLALAAFVTVATLAPTTTDAFIGGSAYGPERRLSLRTPPLIAMLAVAAWTLVIIGATTGALLLAAGTWALGAVALVVGGVAVVLGVRSLHQLSKRWLVLVPTGMVLHDPITMPEPQLFLRQTMARLGPAPDHPDEEVATEDLTAGATGLAMELVLDEPVDLLVRGGPDGSTLRPTTRVLFTPTRPGALIIAARQHRLPTA